MRSIIGLAVLAAAGCSVGSEGSKCNDGLTRLSTELETLPPREAAERVGTGLSEACVGSSPDRLGQVYSLEPQLVGGLLADDAVYGMWERVCPDITEIRRAAMDLPVAEHNRSVYDGCEFARFGLYEERGKSNDVPTVMTFALHGWFLERKLAPERAEIITRALAEVDRLRLSQLDDMESPAARVPPIVPPVAEQIPKIPRSAGSLEALEADIARLRQEHSADGKREIAPTPEEPTGSSEE